MVYQYNGAGIAYLYGLGIAAFGQWPYAAWLAGTPQCPQRLGACQPPLASTPVPVTHMLSNGNMQHMQQAPFSYKLPYKGDTVTHVRNKEMQSKFTLRLAKY